MKLESAHRKQLREKQYTKMDIGNPSRCDMHKPHEGAHALTHSQAILAALSQSFVRTVGNAATWNWVLYKLRDTQHGKTSQATTISILDFRGSTLPACTGPKYSYWI